MDEIGHVLGGQANVTQSQQAGRVAPSQHEPSFAVEGILYARDQTFDQAGPTKQHAAVDTCLGALCRQNRVSIQVCSRQRRSFGGKASDEGREAWGNRTAVEHAIAINDVDRGRGATVDRDHRAGPPIRSPTKQSMRRKRAQPAIRTQGRNRVVGKWHRTRQIVVGNGDGNVESGEC